MAFERTADFFRWFFQDISPGSTDPQKRVSGPRIMTNYYSPYFALAVGKVKGTDIDEAGSTLTQAVLKLQTAEGKAGIVDDDDYIYILDADGREFGVQKTGAMGAEIVKVVPADQLVEGPGWKVTDFNNATWVDGLWVMVFQFMARYGTSNLILTGGHSNKMTGANIEADAGDTTKIGTKIADLKTAFEQEHEGAGGHSEGVLTTDKLATTLWANGQPARNVVKNGRMRHGPSTYSAISGGGAGGPGSPDGTAPPDGWVAYGGGAIAHTDAEAYRGDYSLRVDGTLTGHGAQGEMDDEFDITQYREKYITLAAKVKVPTNDTAKIGVNLKAGITWGAAGGVAGEWADVYVSFEVDAAEDTFEPLVALATDGAKTLYYDDVRILEGDIVAGYTPSDYEVRLGQVKRSGFRDYIINGDMELWSEAGHADAWARTGTAVMVEDNVNFVTKGAGGDVTLANADTIKQQVGYIPAANLLYLMRGMYVYFMFWLKWISGTGPVTIRITDSGGSAPGNTPVTFQPVTGGFLRYGFRHKCDSDFSDLVVSFENQTGAGAINFLLDAAELAISDIPLAYELPDAYRLIPYTFTLPYDPMGTTQLNYGGVTVGQIRPGRTLGPLNIHVRQDDNSLAGGNTYTVFTGVPAGVAGQAVNVPTATAEASASAETVDASTWRVPPKGYLWAELTTYNGFAGAGVGQAYVSVNCLVAD